MIWHAIERALIHGFSSMGVLTAVFFGVAMLARRKPGWPLPHKISRQLLLCAGMVVFVAFLREPYDVAVIGDPLWKSYIDLGSWIIGVTLGYWALYRFVRMDWY